MNPKTHHNRNIRELFDLYIDECIYIKQLRPATIKSYKEVFDNFQTKIPEIIGADDVSPGLVLKFFKILGINEAKTSTIRTYYNKLMPFFRWLETYGHIQKGSLVRNIIAPPQPRYEDSKALSHGEIASIHGAITLHRFDDHFILCRDIAILSILIYTGVRKGELLGLRIKDIDWIEKRIYVNGKTSKSKKGRFIPINPTLNMHLKHYLAERNKTKSTSEYLLLSRRNTAITEHGLKFWVNTYSKISGIPFHLHRFRHTFACTLAKTNADLTSIKAVMGHSSISMTERYLRSITGEGARNYIDSMNY